ncbi:unnamed protein product, partial [Allacma fusca]
MNNYIIPWSFKTSNEKNKNNANVVCHFLHLLDLKDTVTPRKRKIIVRSIQKSPVRTASKPYKFIKHWRAKHLEQVVGEMAAKMEESDVKSDIEEIEDLDEQDVDKDAEFRVDPVSIAAGY